MKKMIISSTLILSMTAFVINFCACGNKETEAPIDRAQPIKAPAETKETPTEETTRGGLTNGEVVELTSEDQFNQLMTQGNVVVDFYAVWCGPCKALAPVIHDLAKENKHITFIKVNTETFSGLSSKYNIRSLPTLIFFKNEQKVDLIKGSQSKSNLQSKLNSIFAK